MVVLQIVHKVHVLKFSNYMKSNNIFPKFRVNQIEPNQLFINSNVCNFLVYSNHFHMFDTYRKIMCPMSRMGAKDGQYLRRHTWHLLYLLICVKIILSTISEILQHFSIKLKCCSISDSMVDVCLKNSKWYISNQTTRLIKSNVFKFHIKSN